jgi:hypothetical protein
MYSAFFMNMVAEKLWNNNFYAWRFGFGKISCSWQRQVRVQIRSKTYRNESVLIKSTFFLLNGQWKRCVIFIFFCIFSCRFTIICLKKVFLNTNFYFVYNIYISEKCMTQMNIENIFVTCFHCLQLNLLLNGKTFILQYLFKL